VEKRLVRTGALGQQPVHLEVHMLTCTKPA